MLYSKNSATDMFMCTEPVPLILDFKKRKSTKWQTIFYKVIPIVFSGSCWNNSILTHFKLNKKKCVNINVIGIINVHGQICTSYMTCLPLVTEADTGEDKCEREAASITSSMSLLNQTRFNMIPCFFTSSTAEHIRVGRKRKFKNYQTVCWLLLWNN